MALPGRTLVTGAAAQPPFLRPWNPVIMRQEALGARIKGEGKEKSTVVMSANRLYATLIELVGLPSTSGHEEHVRQYLDATLQAQGLTTSVDPAGNLIALL